MSRKKKSLNEFIRDFSHIFKVLLDAYPNTQTYQEIDKKIGRKPSYTSQVRRRYKDFVDEFCEIPKKIETYYGQRIKIKNDLITFKKLAEFFINSEPKYMGQFLSSQFTNSLFEKHGFAQMYHLLRYELNYPDDLHRTISKCLLSLDSIKAEFHQITKEYLDFYKNFHEGKLSNNEILQKARIKTENMFEEIESSTYERKKYIPNLTLEILYLLELDEEYSTTFHREVVYPIALKILEYRDITDIYKKFLELDYWLRPTTSNICSAIGYNYLDPSPKDFHLNFEKNIFKNILIPFLDWYNGVGIFSQEDLDKLEERRLIIENNFASIVEETSGIKWTTYKEEEFRKLFHKIVKAYEKENEPLNDEKICEILERRLKQKNLEFIKFLSNSIFFWNIVKRLNPTVFFEYFLEKYPGRKYKLLIRGNGLYYIEVGRELTQEEKYFEEESNKENIDYLQNMPMRDFIRIRKKFSGQCLKAIALDDMIQEYLDRDTPKLFEIAKEVVNEYVE